jgi:hypothetical protein
MSERAKTDAADLKLAVIGARAAAYLTPVVLPRLEFLRPALFYYETLLGHKAGNLSSLVLWSFGLLVFMMTN